MAAKNTQDRGIYLLITEKDYVLFEQNKKEAHRVITKYLNEQPDFFPYEPPHICLLRMTAENA